MIIHIQTKTAKVGFNFLAKDQRIWRRGVLRASGLK
jgi:hypothetical protein